MSASYDLRLIEFLWLEVVSRIKLNKLGLNAPEINNNLDIAQQGQDDRVPDTDYVDREWNADDNFQGKTDESVEEDSISTPGVRPQHGVVQNSVFQ